MWGRTLSEGLFGHRKLEAVALGPTEAKGMLVETNSGKVASHVMTVLHWAEDEEEAKENNLARSKGTSRSGIKMKR